MLRRVIDAAADELRDAHRALLRNMSHPRLVLLHRMVSAMTREIEQSVEVQDPLFSVEFAEAVGDQLLLHHATHEEPVNKKTFEYVFRNAAEASGHAARVNTNTTDASEDVRVDDVKFSLKTEAAKRQSKAGIYIQKLMEARWIRDCDTPVELAATASRAIPEHLDRYERIVLLRGRREADSVLYTLVEIPKRVLMLVATLTADSFELKNKFGSSGANVFEGGDRIFRLYLDGSVEKVRVFNLRLDRCIVRMRWRVPLAAVQSRDADA
jgi:Type II site-specific deoxyribonuclease